MSGVMDCGTSKCSNYLVFLTSVYMICLTNLLQLFFFLHKDKTKQSHISIDLKNKTKQTKKKESAKQCFNWWDMANPRGLWFPRNLQSSSADVSSWLQVRAFCSRWLWCWCRESSWTLGGSSLNCWDRPVAASPLSGVGGDTCEEQRICHTAAWTSRIKDILSG